ncbi:YkgJ family cysteine cluster protein [Neomegalonema perideroedes]|uniref:YkgJ family cysteine cluster protein n=1 Tax=Neomegalonema perideroedes TaxID=217219 RepID=UPI000A03A460
MRKPFPCDQCGECCKRAGLIAETRSLDRGDGVCRHFDDQSRQCMIYHERPEVCRVDLQYMRKYRALMSWESFVDLNMQACDELKRSSSSSANPAGD